MTRVDDKTVDFHQRVIQNANQSRNTFRRAGIGRAGPVGISTTGATGAATAAGSTTSIGWWWSTLILQRQCACGVIQLGSSVIEATECCHARLSQGGGASQVH